MAEGYQNMPKVPIWYTATDTGITGITAIKYGNLVQLYFTNVTASSQNSGFAIVGTLSASLRPYTYIYGNMYDNDASTFADNKIIDVRIANNGQVALYLFSDKLSVKASGNIMYITAPDNG